MLKLLAAAVLGSLLTVLLLGYLVGSGDLPGKDWLKKHWPPSAPKKVAEPASLWKAQPTVRGSEIEVTAWGAASRHESQNRSHAVALALRTARHSAYEQLAEHLSGARTTSRSHYHGDVLQQAALTTRAAAVIRGAKVVREDVAVLDDGSVRAVVTLRHPVPKKAGA
jgi:hypothetical protein